MNGWNSKPLPQLTVADFGPTLDHVAEAYLGGKVFAILHKDDPARKILPLLTFAVTDPFMYVYIHGGDAVTRFENHETPTHEIPISVAGRILETAYGSGVRNLPIRLCSCYANLLRTGEPETLASQFARELNLQSLEAYHGTFLLRSPPPRMKLGVPVRWDDQLRFPVVTGLMAGNWEIVAP